MGTAKSGPGPHFLVLQTSYEHLTKVLARNVAVSMLSDPESRREAGGDDPE
jgi:hypothetical protein